MFGQEISLDFDVNWGTPSEGEHAETSLRTLSLDGLAEELEDLPRSIRELVLSGLEDDQSESYLLTINCE